jgi:signal transduction histidine kinase/CheY-like chemotaxis protein
MLACGTIISAVNWWAVATDTTFPSTSLVGPLERAAGFALTQLALGLVVVISMGFMLTRLREALAHQVVTANRLTQEAHERQQMVEELQEANHALSDNQARLIRAGKVEVLGQLAGTVAHDLNNVLTVVLAEADLARDHAEEHADAILEAVDEAVQLTRQLLVVGRQDLARPEPVDLAVLLEGARRLLQRITPGNVSLTLEADPVVVRADPVQIRQVLLNLCANAVQAMPKGGLLEVRVTQTDTHAQVSVRDTGIGMDEATRAHIFEPFFTTRTADAGSGLGLASVYSITEELGGTIECRSALGKGTTFLLTLPRCDEPPTTSKLGEETEVSGRLEGCVVLLAEDEDRVRHTLATTLRKAGARVVEAADGQSAVALAELEPRLDLVWTDVIMPRGGGRALVDWVRAHRPDTPIVVSSGWADEPTLRAELAAGRHAFVPKPFTPAQALAHAVDAVQKASGPAPSAPRSTQAPSTASEP